MMVISLGFCWQTALGFFAPLIGMAGGPVGISCKMTGKTQDNRTICELSVSSLATWKVLAALSTIGNPS